jgi:hypothetical protein
MTASAMNPTPIILPHVGFIIVAAVVSTLALMIM